MLATQPAHHMFYMLALFIIAGAVLYGLGVRLSVEAKPEAVT